MVREGRTIWAFASPDQPWASGVAADDGSPVGPLRRTASIVAKSWAAEVAT